VKPMPIGVPQLVRLSLFRNLIAAEVKVLVRGYPPLPPTTCSASCFDRFHSGGLI
jgi:hypothetical protein